MNLLDLEPRWRGMPYEGPSPPYIATASGFTVTFPRTDTIQEAFGIEFLCPVCFVENKGRIGTHHVICWSPSVPQKFPPIPGRWRLVGNGFHDLSLVAGSSSVLLPTEGGCKAHFHVTDGKIIMLMPTDFSALELTSP